MTRHQYRNTKPDDLYVALELYSKYPVGKIMKGWAAQKGFPVVLVRVNIKLFLIYLHFVFFSIYPFVDIDVSQFQCAGTIV